MRAQRACQKSPRREIDLSETVDRFEFLMDAPEFLQDRFPDSSTDGDENLSPPASASLGLLPRSSFEIEDDSKPHSAEASVVAQPPSAPTLVEEKRPTPEIDEPTAEVSDSFEDEDDVDVMERMLPLPWLMKPSNKNNNKKKRLA